MNTYQKRKVFNKYLIIACFIALSNVLFCFNFTVSFIIIMAEVICLLILFLRKRMADYICYYMFFMCNCMEYAVFTGSDDFYGFKNFRIAGINIGIIMLFPIFINAIVYLKKLLVIRKNNVSRFCFGLLGINLIAAIVGGVLVLINDNNILSVGNTLYNFIQKAYAMIFIPMAFMIGIAIVFIKRDGSSCKISLGLQAVLWANVFQMITSLLSGITGTYGYLTTMQVSIINFLIPFLILLFFYKEEVVYPKLTLIIGILGALLSIMNNANGKLIIICVICFGTFLFLALRDGTSTMKIFSFVAVLVGIGGIGFFINFLSQNALFNAKFEDVKSLLNVFSRNWLMNLSQSPRVRIEEFRDIIIEFTKKPWLIFTGKGYLGSIIDHTGYFYSHIMSADGFVSDPEWAHGIFFNLHEGASFLLMYGVIGIIFMLKSMLKCAKIFFKSRNIWVLIGAYWFLLYYGYSFTLGTYGCVSLLYGLFSSEYNKRNKA